MIMLTVAKYNDKDLLALIAKGDRLAFKQLYSGCLDDLYRFIFLFTKSKEETEDILQEIFIKIWENREKLSEVNSLKNYLFRFAKNKLLDNIRHLQVRQRVLSEIRRTRDVSGNITADQYTYREYYQLVQQAIEKLPPKRKLIFQLNIENGLSLDEIAGQLNISRSVVQKQIYKASYFVRDYLFKHSEPSFCIVAAFFLSAF
ncbi:MAG: RNA polymerase sigma-70 factor [Chitinophagaceae bacterium]|nr:RNA polymerase sigma-70 factor [Chitinophagaceae bacterium]